MYDIFVIHKLHISEEEEEDVKNSEESAPLLPGQAADLHTNNLNIRYRGYGTGEVTDRLVAPGKAKNIQEQPQTGIGNCYVCSVCCNKGWFYSYTQQIFVFVDGKDL